MIATLPDGTVIRLEFLAGRWFVRAVNARHMRCAQRIEPSCTDSPMRCAR